MPFRKQKKIDRSQDIELSRHALEVDMVALKQLAMKITKASDTLIGYLDKKGSRSKSGDYIIMNTIPTSAIPIKVTPGWVITQELLGDESDVFICYAKKGCILEKHSHLQNEVIKMLKGKLLVHVRDEEYIISSGESLSIESYTPHSCIAIDGDALLRVTFTPPITNK